MRKFKMGAVKPQLLASVMAAALLGACSSDVARFNDDPFQNPFNSRTSFDPASTNSINRNRAPAPAPKSFQPMPQSTASSQPLPPPGQVQGLNPNASLTTGSVKSGVAAANYPALVASPRPATGGVAGATTGWSAVGGTPVTLQQGESVNTLAQRYNVPVSAIMAVNGLSSVQQARPGQQIMIPAYNAVSGSNAPGKVAASHVASPQATAVISRAPQPLPAASARSASALAPVPPRNVQPLKVAASPAARNVAPQPVSDAEKRAAQKLREIRSGKTEAETKADAAKKKAEAAKAEIKLAEKKKAEAIRLAEKKKALEEAQAAKAAKIAAARKKKADDNITTASLPEPKADLKSNSFAAQPMPQAEPRQPEIKQPQANDDQFRWPAKGRVISGFGARGTGGANDGINIALPEGTPVRAAEGGTVVHADDALKGYGKLVLIRHPNGYVSVYAHNGELSVKRGENVKRGQVIAKSGATGNVTAPQLHFEIRKGSTPVDPSKYLGE